MNSNISTGSTIKLNEASLSRLPNNIRVPNYDRHQIINGIVHIGVGGFHRAHQALYLDNYLQQSCDREWGICGVGLLEFDRRMRDALHSQDCLYTLVERSTEGDWARVIGSITRYLFAPDNRARVIDALADPHCRIVTLTITEAGYYYIEGSGEFDANHPTIQHDLQHPHEPIGVYGFLTAALDKRRQQGLQPFTVLSCDNLQGNGNIARKMLTAFAKLQDPELGNWMSDRVTFPNCMVDRITPATTAADIKMVAEQFQIDDAFPVVAEPFLQWVVEDNFCAGRPDLESVGVQMTDDVHPYEMMKIRLLNASHLLIGYLGTLAGYTYVHEVMADPAIRQAVDRLMAEVTPTLQPVPGIDLDDYKQTLIQRFANPKIQDRLPRLCLNSAAKMPKFILGSLRDALRQDGAINYLSLTIAAWFRYLKGQDDRGNPIEIDDPMADILIQRARSGGSDPIPLLSLSEIFGDLSRSSRFVEAVSKHLHNLDEFGAKGTLTR
ncbi:MAG: Mannitol 2-dehydrogenase [Chroococcidiopsis sp. SAG 2025]|uniref:mannitol dehydrogenase family protein n=1 Tax=Chroococcidiopsis sp. SAG 2025 TaxID=171389 RepID=UPI0029372593|nr:mannitol dehydrogenase family protein [Chroococcidiopsis sp. SAG 2025]MDV2995629.1 Mannitol 2-dehydrogenase [Chroococcidiopsis sp. SAG 2025]